MINPVENYLTNIRDIFQSGGGVGEESYYGSLESLLNEVGKSLKPCVRAVNELKNSGAGEPDFGLYTAEQYQRDSTKPIAGVIPQRGVIEAKAWYEELAITAESLQVRNYLRKYGLVLVTNYRDFLLIERDKDASRQLERFTLCETADDFAKLFNHPRSSATEFGDRFIDYLKRVLTHQADLTDPQDLAWHLASYAREARARVEMAKDLPGLANLREALEETLGMKFEGKDGEHFFRATLVQTLFYGIFSAWVLWARDHSNKTFDWRTAGWNLHVPMIAGLFDQIATPQRLKPLRVDEVLDWAGHALNHVDQDAFFSKFEEEQAVQYFYEPFLQAYDPELRKKYGVWYTPPEIVKFQVERVDQVLREELDLPDGLADSKVVILDPACGTGAYLVETLRRIHRTLEAKDGGALVAEKLKQAAIKRVFGFEIMPAPFVISHLQIGLLLRQLGAPLKHDHDSERAGVFLTNALTGWEPAEDPKLQLPFPEFQVERDLADKVKRDEPIIVIMGNPPYNAFAGTSPKEEGGLVDVYKENLTKPVKDGGWGIKKFNLDDLYIRFFRIAERRIMKTGQGIISYISNFSYLNEPSFVIMRQRFIHEFNQIWIDCMNGDSRETGKLTPDGKPDPSVFSTKKHPIGIRKGTAICIMVRRLRQSKKPAFIRFRNYWGVTKRDDLLNSLKLKDLKGHYRLAESDVSNRFSFRPYETNPDYLKWPRLTDLSLIDPITGYKENRGFSLIDTNRSNLIKKMKEYYDSSIDWSKLVSHGYRFTKNAARYEAEQTRQKVLTIESFNPNHIFRYQLRPFELQWCYYSPVHSLWNRARPSLFKHHSKKALYIVSRPSAVATPEGIPLFATKYLGDFDFIRGHAYHFPLTIQYKVIDKSNNHSLFEGEIDDFKPNISKAVSNYLKNLGIKPTIAYEYLWNHVLSIGYSPCYLRENKDGIRIDWLRIPLPTKKDDLLKSAELGQKIASLLDTDSDVDGVTVGSVSGVLRKVGILRKVNGSQVNLERGDLDLNAGWGHPGKDNMIMPGRGRIREYKVEDKEQKDSLGDLVYDIFLNNDVYWANIPATVWNYYIGGYQVIKKWLSYREKKILGRGLTLAEAEFFTMMTRRITALVLLQSDLDENYRRIKENTYLW